MAVLEILTYPNEKLHRIAKPVDIVDDRIRTIISDMAETMYEKNGIGLAATQVDIHERIIVIDVSDERNDLLILINPEIITKEGETEYQEGCLSVPGIYEVMKRSEKVTVEAVDLSGNKRIIHADGLLAICIQHEIDHINGKVFVDYLSRLKQSRIKSKLLKQLN